MDVSIHWDGPDATPQVPTPGLSSAITRTPTTNSTSRFWNETRVYAPGVNPALVQMEKLVGRGLAVNSVWFLVAVSLVAANLRVVRYVNRVRWRVVAKISSGREERIFQFDFRTVLGKIESEISSNLPIFVQRKYNCYCDWGWVIILDAGMIQVANKGWCSFIWENRIWRFVKYIVTVWNFVECTDLCSAQI